MACEHCQHVLEAEHTKSSPSGASEGTLDNDPQLDPFSDALPEADGIENLADWHNDLSMMPDMSFGGNPHLANNDSCSHHVSTNEPTTVHVNVGMQNNFGPYSGSTPYNTQSAVHFGGSSQAAHYSGMSQYEAQHQHYASPTQPSSSTSISISFPGSTPSPAPGYSHPGYSQIYPPAYGAPQSEARTVTTVYDGRGNKRTTTVWHDFRRPLEVRVESVSNPEADFGMVQQHFPEPALPSDGARTVTTVYDGHGHSTSRVLCHSALPNAGEGSRMFM